MPIDQDIAERQQKQYTNPSNNKSFTGKANKYQLNLLQYPSDLGGPDLKHYVEFQITVRGKSEFNKDNRLFEVARDPDSANLSTEQVAQAATSAGQIAAGVVGYKVAKNILGKFGKTGAVKGNTTALGTTKAADTAIAAGVGAGAALATGAVMSANKLLKPDTKYRISEVIALHIENPPAVKYSMNYANKDLGTLAGMLSGGIMESMGALNPMGEKGAAAFQSFAKLPGMLGSVDMQSAIGVSAGTALNPFKEVVFESVDFRSFAFKYRFMPKNAAESEAVKNIIKLFKFHMHPEMSEQKLFFIYPSEFQITYYFEGAENPYFHKFAPCALESMEVTYGGEQFSAFRDGHPTEVNMTLTFRELEIMTKKMIDKGY